MLYVHCSTHHCTKAVLFQVHYHIVQLFPGLYLISVQRSFLMCVFVHHFEEIESVLGKECFFTSCGNFVLSLEYTQICLTYVVGKVLTHTMLSKESVKTWIRS